MRQYWVLRITPDHGFAMPDYTPTRRDDRPTEGFSTTHLPSEPDRPVRLFLPADYQPKYAYPLVVLFHSNGGDEDSTARLLPSLSRRNYIAACPRGPIQLGRGITGRQSFAWGEPNAQEDEYLLATIAHARQEYHIHSERVYFIGVGEGASVAFRLAMSMAIDVAGMALLNARMPSTARRPYSRLRAFRGLPVFIGHGTKNPITTYSSARAMHRYFNSVGAEVRLESYATTHRIHPDMLRDVNRWIMGAVTTEPDTLPLSTQG
jgi:phospholipase/carboxylesterase